jgi:hypothetical protein
LVDPIDFFDRKLKNEKKEIIFKKLEEPVHEDISVHQDSFVKNTSIEEEITKGNNKSEEDNIIEGVLELPIEDVSIIIPDHFVKKSSMEEEITKEDLSKNNTKEDPKK